jgi:hypothetical protein
MTYRIAGMSTEFCSCTSPCPCAFGQEPDNNGHCQGIFSFHVQDGNVDGVDVSETVALFAVDFRGVWTSGNWTAALILDDKASQEQRDALTRVFGGELGGDAAQLAAFVGDFKGVFTAPIDYRDMGDNLYFHAGETAEGDGSILKNVDGSQTIEIEDAHYPIPRIEAGKSTLVRVKVSGMEFQHNGSGMWHGPFTLRG